MAKLDNDKVVLDDNSSLHAKAIFLGDVGTGKTKLIESLNPVFAPRPGDGGSQELFNIIEFDKSELERSDVNVVLKVWEGGGHIDPIAFQGSLFCIITIDIRSPESVESAFSRWINVKEKYMDECFLVVVGNFLDKSIARRVAIKKLCAMCAEKDAAYVEVSNMDGTNIPLLRQILCTRVDHVRKIRDEFMERQDAFRGARTVPPDLGDAAGKEGLPELERSGDEANTILDAPFLEHDILPDSIGNVLASSMGLEYWPGLDNETETLQRIGGQIGDLINRLGQQDAKFPKKPLEFSIGPNPNADASEPSHEELREAFEVLGFDLPPSLGGERVTEKARMARRSQYMLNVTLPHGSPVQLALQSDGDLMSQIDEFCAVHSMNDPEHRARLLDSASSAMRMMSPAEKERLRAAEAGIDPDEEDLRQEKSGKASMFKVKLLLTHGVEREAVVQTGEDPVTVASRLKRLYNLKKKEEELVLEQLIPVLKK